MQTIIENNWIRCGKCGHKLGRLVDDTKILPKIEIKCHSCKALNELYYRNSKKEDVIDGNGKEN